MKKRISVKLKKGIIMHAKPEPRDLHQSRNSRGSLALPATDSLELKLS